MKVFYNGTAPEMTLSVCPAGHLPAAECQREWFEEDGATPKTFPIRFAGGEAIVDDPLGRYLRTQGIVRFFKIAQTGLTRLLSA